MRRSGLAPRASLFLSSLGILVTAYSAAVGYMIIEAMGRLDWEAGREAGLVEALGVFGLGATLLFVVAVWALFGAIWSRRTPRKAMWLSIGPGIIGLIVAVGAAMVFALNDGLEGAMAVAVPVGYGLGPFLLLLAGLIARRQHRRADAEALSVEDGLGLPEARPVQEGG